MEGKCIIICAPSGAGKTSITKHLLKQNLNLSFSISACTREKRADEEDGKDYYFLDVDTFKKRIDEDAFVEWEEVYQDQFYGTLKAEIERIWSLGKNVIFDVDVEGGLSLTKHFGEKALAIFIKAPTVADLEARLRKRGSETEEKIQKRMAKAEKELSYAKWFDTVIVNSNLEESQEEAYKIVKSFIKK